MPRKEANRSKNRQHNGRGSGKSRKSAGKKQKRALGQTRVLEQSAIEQSVQERLSRPFPLLSQTLPEKPIIAKPSRPARAPSVGKPAQPALIPAPKNIRAAVQPLSLPGWLPAGAALLLGLAGACQWSGARTLFTALIDPLPATATMAAVIALFLTAMGMALHGRMAASRWASIPPLMSIALLSIVAGFVSLLSVALSGPASRAYDRLLDGFFWTNLSLAGLDWLAVASLLALPCIALGMLMARLLTVAGTPAQADLATPLIPATLLGGAVAGLVLNDLGASPSAQRQIILGTLPLFLLAFGGLAWSHKYQPAQEQANASPRNRQAPGSGRPTLILTSFGLLAICMSWLSLEVRGQAELSTFSALLTGGIMVGYLIAHAQQTNIGRLSRATATWICGTGAAVAAMLAAWSPHHSWSLAIRLLAVSLPGGYMLYVCLRARADRRVGSWIALLVGAALGLAAVRWWGFPQLGAMGTLAAGSFLLMAAGGLLEIHSERRFGWLKSLRLAVVFASLAAAMLLMPGSTRAWARRDQQQVASAAPPLHASRELLSILQDVRTACLIGVEPQTAGNLLDSLPPGRLTQAEVLPLATWWPRDWQAHQTEVINVVSMPAARALRLSHGRYQLVYQFMCETDEPAVFCSAEWLSRLSRHLAPGGTLIVDLPLAALDRQTLVNLAATFERANISPFCWFLQGGEYPRLILQSGRPPEADGQHLGLPLDTLLQAPNLHPRVFSLRQRSASDRGPRPYRARSPEEYSRNLTDLLGWMRECAGGVLPVAEPAPPRP